MMGACVRACVYVCVTVCVCACVCVCVCVYARARARVFVRVCASVYMCLRAWVRGCVRVRGVYSACVCHVCVPPPRRSRYDNGLYHCCINSSSLWVGVGAERGERADDALALGRSPPAAGRKEEGRSPGGREGWRERGREGGPAGPGPVPAEGHLKHGSPGVRVRVGCSDSA
jgi:hypothetical protein